MEKPKSIKFDELLEIMKNNRDLFIKYDLTLTNDQDIGSSTVVYIKFVGQITENKSQ